jgi:hypothetical protein
MDFQSHELDPGWRCKHIIAVFDVRHSPIEHEGFRVANMAGPPGNHEAARADGVIALREEPTPPQMLLRRSVSPDGKIDSLSVEISLPVEERTKTVVEDQAAKIMEVQQGIVARFLNKRSDAPTHEKLQASALPEAIPAQLVEIGGRDGRWGRRLYISIRTSEKNFWFFGTRDQLAEAITAAGFSFTANDIVEGRQLDLPCRIMTKPSTDGRYVNIDHVLPAEKTVRTRAVR